MWPVSLDKMSDGLEDSGENSVGDWTEAQIMENTGYWSCLQIPSEDRHLLTYMDTADTLGSNNLIF